MYTSHDTWQGVTYKEDKPGVMATLKSLKEDGWIGYNKRKRQITLCIEKWQPSLKIAILLFTAFLVSGDARIKIGHTEWRFDL